MRISNPVPFIAILCLSCAFCAAQSPPPSTSPSPTPPPAHPVPAGSPQATPSAPAASPAPAASLSPGSPSASLQPSLDAVQQVLIALKMDKWKKGTVRTETSDKIALIIKDLHETLPPLMSAGDAAPGLISNQLPVSRNVGALYDVLLRVFEAARVSAPPEQIARLDQVLAALNTARVAYDDRLQDSAVAVEKQVGDLQNTVKSQAAFKCSTPAPVMVPVCPPPPTAPKVRRKPKPPATTTPQTTPAPGAAASPKPAN